MIKVKILQLINSAEMLQKLSKQDFTAKLAWKIARLLKAAEAEIQSFNETRMTLINKYGEKDENGQLITDEIGNCKIDEASVTEFSKQLNDLLDTEVEINANKMKMEDLEEVKFTPNEIGLLEPFLETEDE